MSTPFAPQKAATVNIDVASTTANVQVAPTGTTGTYQCRVMNNGTATAWIGFGDNTVTASATANIPVPAGAIEVLTVTGTHAAAIAAAATGKIYFTPGAGI